MKANLTEKERAVILACKGYFTEKFDGYKLASNIINQLIYGNFHSDLLVIQIENVKEILIKAKMPSIHSWHQLDARITLNAYSSCSMRGRLELQDFLQEVFSLYCSELACLKVYDTKSDETLLDLTISDELEKEIRDLTIS